MTRSFLEAQNYLNSFINHEFHLGRVKSSSFKLERVHRLLNALGNPHRNLKIIHVAGSKGKGSICAMTAGILRQTGYTVGLYTSPHINNYRERVRVLSSRARRNGAKQSHRLFRRFTPRDDMVSDIFPDCVSEKELEVVLKKIKPAVEKTRSREGLGDLSFFEVYTVLALFYFCQQNVDVVILETGLGGRLDATNAVDSLVAAIAPISLEHTTILGDTLTAIAKEKAAIIKDGRQRVVIAPQDDEAMEVLTARCQEFNIEPVCIRKINSQIELSLLGPHQKENAAVSIGIVECLRDLGFEISTEAVRRGLKNVFWPGRFEIIQRGSLIVLDGAHNIASAKVLAATVKEVFEGKKIVMVLGVSEDKDKESLCAEFRKITQDIIFTKANHPRAGHLEGAVDVGQALNFARARSDPDDIIVVTGSVFVVAEARRSLMTVGT